MHKAVEALHRELPAQIINLDAVAMQSHPIANPAKWTIQQIVEHLLLTYKATCQAFETQIAKGTPTSTRATTVQRLGQWILIDAGLFPPGRQAPSIVVPSLDAAAVAGRELATEAEGLLVRFDKLAGEAEERFGKHRAIRHPILGPLSAAQWRGFHLVHGRHHLKQIASIRRAHGL